MSEWYCVDCEATDVEPDYSDPTQRAPKCPGCGSVDMYDVSPGREINRLRAENERLRKRLDALCLGRAVIEVRRGYAEPVEVYIQRTAEPNLGPLWVDGVFQGHHLMFHPLLGTGATIGAAIDKAMEVDGE